MYASFIPANSYVDALCLPMPVTESSFRDLATVLQLPAIFVAAIFDRRYNVHSCGEGFFVQQGSGAPANLGIGGKTHHPLRRATDDKLIRNLLPALPL